MKWGQEKAVPTYRVRMKGEGKQHKQEVGFIVKHLAHKAEVPEPLRTMDLKEEVILK